MPSPMSCRWRIAVLGGLALTFGVLQQSAVSAAGIRTGLISRHPRIIRYDPLKDEFVHQRSVLGMIPQTRPGGDLSYSGNRLTQFRYTGRPGTGGIYDALDEYKRELKLKPRNYEYRR